MTDQHSIIAAGMEAMRLEIDRKIVEGLRATLALELVEPEAADQ